MKSSEKILEKINNRILITQATMFISGIFAILYLISIGAFILNDGLKNFSLSNNGLDSDLLIGNLFFFFILIIYNSKLSKAKRKIEERS